MEKIWLRRERRDTVKSFRLVSLQVVTSEEDLVDIELTEGLIINKEDEHNRWLLEGFIHQDHHQHLLDTIKDRRRVKIQVVISKKENNPAIFDTELLTIKKVDDYYSVLFEGCIVYSQIEYATVLLEHLIKEGLEGKELVNEFKDKMRTKPRIVAVRNI